jgi:1A family penicillin-binding protein
MKFFGRHKNKLAAVLKALIIGVILIAGGLVVWGSTLTIPSLDSFDERKIFESTKIYDRTGEVVLYDFNNDVRRTVIPIEDMSQNIIDATVAIEDDRFWHHHGVRPLSFLRAAWVNLQAGGFSQGGSTITQQVVKNSLLTTDKTVSRKVKEWILAIRLENEMSKKEILEVYLNEIPYGGTIYGIQEASRYFFGKDAAHLTLAESAYLASLPQAPTYYSPTGNHRDDLEIRKNKVLEKMLELGNITQEEYEQAKNTKVTFLNQDERTIRAPHFVFFVREYLEQKYGARAVEEGGLKVVTTLDWELQQKAQEIVKTNADSNETNFLANNAALTAIDPKTGQIIVMVGSRDWNNDDIDGKVNVATSLNQPGSTFKPFIYATAFEKGFTPDSIIFDLKTQFSTACSPQSFVEEYPCYSPNNYDFKFRGPMTMRDALSQSVNIPAVKTFYLVGQQDALQAATDMGVGGLEDAGNGLSLALGAHDVTLLDMTSAYGVFANDGVRLAPTPILKIEDRNGKILEEFTPEPEEVIPANVARMVSDVLSDNVARTPEFGANSWLYFDGQPVADKTGTTNESRDAWTIGYTRNLVVGTWAGNNDNTPMVKQIAGFIVAPMWNEFMKASFAKYPPEPFPAYQVPHPENHKPMIRGGWQPNGSNVDGNDQNNVFSGGVHTILYWVNRSDPLGPPPSYPASDPQYTYWEYPVQLWLHGESGGTGSSSSTPNNIPVDLDDVDDVVKHAEDLLKQLQERENRH